MEADSIKTVFDLHGLGVRELAAMHHAARQRRGLRSSRPVETTSGHRPLPACINHGRWLVACPWCAGAELVDPADPVFYCLSCQNEQAGNQLVIVAFPEQREALERLLLRRPDPKTRNWLEGETVDDLLRENAAHGVS